MGLHATVTSHNRRYSWDQAASSLPLRERFDEPGEAFPLLGEVLFTFSRPPLTLANRTGRSEEERKGSWCFTRAHLRFRTNFSVWRSALRRWSGASLLVERPDDQVREMGFRPLPHRGEG